ncbi:MAG: insulinase family protein [Deltaproteobacteria bacterium]|nr:insulinase family protein [Deltaproteobacteria bacterium]
MDYKLKIGDSLCGYNVTQANELPEINSQYYKLTHAKTGAEHVHIKNKDRENTFSVAFKTIPRDSTGIAHILEHTVLCGSKKFPVRDPFFSMIKRSLNTFMNAFTASDWTMYPFSTQNKKDFYNLMDVYLDAAFFPDLDELSFKQEGHRIETDENNPEASKLIYKGVVYNEMKGAMSSPDQVMVRSLLNALYPSTTYRFNSGGEPSAIPKLTHAHLKQFHARHYHPSNAFFYTYGDLALKDHLEFIEAKILDRFKKINPDTDVPSQPLWKHPKSVEYKYPLSKNEEPTEKFQVCVAWLTTDIKDSFEVLTLILLSQILLGNSGSPLRKELIESQLGTALSSGTGFDSDLRDTFFACGLKDVKAENTKKIETIILDVMESLVEKGIDPKMIESAIHQVEFRRKEITNTPYPYGIKLLLAFSGTWFHGGNPEDILLLDRHLTRIHDEISKGGFFESKIKKYFLDNPHRVTLTLAPDQTMEERENKETEKELAVIRNNMAQTDLAKIKNDVADLKSLQESDEDTSCLPTLEIQDIPPEIQTVEKADQYKSLPADFYSQPTSGIMYFSAATGINEIPENLLPLIPFFCTTLTRVGTAVHDYTEIAQLIDTHTGGVGLTAHASTGFRETTCIPFVTLNGKCLVRKQGKMFELIDEFVNKFNFSDLKRLKSILLEYQAGMESMIVQSGHRLAISLASRNFSFAGALNEEWYGIHQLQTIKQITSILSGDEKSDKKLQKLSDDLAAIANILFKPDNMRIALIGEDKTLKIIADSKAPLLMRTSKGSSSKGFRAPDIQIDSQIPREGWSTSTSVSFVAAAFKTVCMGHKDSPALAVISKMMRSMYLHREIREKGGAYGGFSTYSPESGMFCLASYRDPHIAATLKAFDGAAAFIRSGNYSEEDIKEAILQVCSDIDNPDSPGMAAQKAFYRNIIGLSDKARKKYKEMLLEVTSGMIKKTAKIYFSGNMSEKAVAVISGEEKLKKVNTKLNLELRRI